MKCYGILPNDSIMRIKEGGLELALFLFVSLFFIYKHHLLAHLDQKISIILLSSLQFCKTEVK